MISRRIVEFGVVREPESAEFDVMVFDIGIAAGLGNMLDLLVEPLQKVGGMHVVSPVARLRCVTWAVPWHR